MVFKTTKHNVRSGNTLRAISSRHRGISEHPLIWKTSTNYQGHVNEDGISNGYIICGEQLIWDGFGADDEFKVPCSLKKKGRWRLADILCAAIEQPSGVDEDSGANVDDDAVDISVLQHHQIHRQADCFRYTSTKHDAKKCANKNTYCDGTVCFAEHGEVGKTTRGSATGRPRRRKDHKWMPQRVVTDAPGSGKKEAAPSLRYDVYNAVPTGSQMVYLQKTRRTEERNSQPASRLKRQQKHSAWNEMRDYEDAMYDFMYGHQEEEGEGARMASSAEGEGGDTGVDEADAVVVPEVVEEPEGDIVIVPEGEAVFVPEGDIVIVPEGEAVFVPEGEAVFVPEGDIVIVPEGEAIFVPEGDDVIVPEEDDIIVAEGEVAFVPEGDDVIVPEDIVIVPEGEVAFVTEGDDVIVPEGNDVIVLKGDEVIVSEGDATYVPEGDIIIIPEGEKEEEDKEEKEEEEEEECEDWELINWAPEEEYLPPQ